MPWVDGRRTADCQEVIPSDMRNHDGRKRDIFSTGIVMSQREDTEEGCPFIACDGWMSSSQTCCFAMHSTMDGSFVRPILIETEKTGEGGRKANKCMHVVRREAKEIQLQSEMNPQICNISNVRFDL